MDQQEYRCQACGAKFDSEADLEVHKRTRHIQYTCEVCGRRFKSASELQTHDRISHPEDTPVW